jgi:hypothetical protein
VNPSNKNHWIGIRWEPKGEEDRRNPGKGPFWRKQEKAAKHGVRLRGLRARVSDGDLSQMSYVPNGKEG